MMNGGRTQTIKVHIDLYSNELKNLVTKLNEMSIEAENTNVKSALNLKMDEVGSKPKGTGFDSDDE